MPDIWVADGIIGDGFAVVSGQQIQPFAVTVGIGVRFCTADTADVAIGVVGVGVAALLVCFACQLVLGIVGVAGTLVCPGCAGDLCNVARRIVRIAQLELRESGTAVPLGVVNGRNLGGLVAAVGAAGGLDLRHYYFARTRSFLSEGTLQNTRKFKCVKVIL